MYLTRTMFLFVLVAAMAMPAPRELAAAPVPVLDTIWSNPGDVLAEADFDGDPETLEIVIYDPLTLRMELREMLTGALIYTFPPDYVENSVLSIMNLDDQPGYELVVRSTIPGLPLRIGVFAIVPTPGVPSPDRFGLKWEALYPGVTVTGIVSGRLTSVFVSDLVVVMKDDFKIHDFVDGSVKYGWLDDGATCCRFVSLEMDRNPGGSLEGILVRTTDRHTGFPQLHYLGMTAPTGVSEGAPPAGPGLLASQNVPNPFTGPTQVSFQVPVRARVRVQVYDAAGRHVRTLLDEVRAAGRHDLTWDGRDARGRAVGTGVFFYEVDAGGERITRKMVRLR